MPLPTESQFQFTPDMRICRILNGMWQVSGAHGRIDPQAAVQNMFDYLDAGFTTWDLADHYGPAEDFIGDRIMAFHVKQGLPAALARSLRPSGRGPNPRLIRRSGRGGL